MPAIISKSKMSKKKQKELNNAKRTSWDFSPVCRVVPSRKIYSRKQKFMPEYD